MSAQLEKKNSPNLESLAIHHLLKVEATKFLPLVAHTKLLPPLVGMLTALMLVTSYQAVASGSFTLNFRPFERGLVELAQYTKTGYQTLGAVGLTLASAEISLPPNWFSVAAPAVSNYWPPPVAAVVAAVGQTIQADFLATLRAFYSGAQELATNLWNTFLAVWNFFTQSLWLFYDSLLSGVGFLAERIEVVVDGWLKPTSEEVSRSAAASVGVVAAQATAWWSQLNEWVQSLWGIVRDRAAAIWGRWQNFLAGDKSAVLPGDGGVDAETKNDIREIKQDVKTLLNLFNQQSLRPSSRSAEGLIVVPQSGSASGDAALRQNLADQFSDPVKVQVDETGKTGVITPVFRAPGEGNYIFLLAPLKQ